MTSSEIVELIVGKQKAQHMTKYHYDTFSEVMVFEVEGSPITYSIQLFPGDVNNLLDFGDIKHKFFDQILPAKQFLLAHNTSLMNDETFVEYTKLKSADGIRYYRIYYGPNQFFRFPMFSGFLKINKGDKVEINIFGFSNVYLLNEVLIDRKKLGGRLLKLYFLTLRDEAVNN